jgi:hypothetical protein
MTDKKYKITKQGSLGLLALGHIGVKQWREVRRKELENQKDINPKNQPNGKTEK